MSLKSNNTQTNPSDCQPPNHGSLILRAIWIVCGATLFIFVLMLSIDHIKLSESGNRIFGMFVYTALIALPSIILLTWISIRFTGKFPRAIIFIQALALICTACAGSLAANWIFWITGTIPRGFFWFAYRRDLPFSVVITLTIGLGITTFETLRYRLQSAKLELRTREVEQERANKLLAEARLSALESRIHPHFLFNTLNSIAALIPSDPVRAEDTVGKLASLLRFSLNAHERGLVRLSEEIKIVRDYLEIEKTRFGARIQYQIEVPETLMGVKVPPLALQSLVENSVKHVVAQRAEVTTIEIRASQDGNRVRLEATDDGPGFTLDAITPEHGLGNLIARLELLYGNAGQLEVLREGNKTAVRLTIPA
jgi:sensor histidine kinase YesM